MADHEERTVCGLRIVIDRLLCVGFEDCVEAAPEVFRMGDDGIVVFTDHATDYDDRERVIEACRICPVDALAAYDADGRALAP